MERKTIRDMLEMLIDTDPELRCMGVFTGASKFIEKLSSGRVDVLLIDADMPGVAIFSLIQFARVHYPEMKIVGMLSGDDHTRVKALMNAGCNTCVFKRTTAEQVLLQLKGTSDR
ncbi:MAG: response regulator [Bacteroidia bacterium]